MTHILSIYLAEDVYGDRICIHDKPFGLYGEGHYTEEAVNDYLDSVEWLLKDCVERPSRRLPYLRTYVKILEFRGIKKSAL